MLFVSRLENKEPFFVVGLPEFTRRRHARSLVHSVAIGDDDNAVIYWLAPLQTTCEEIFEAGFVIERLLEPRPVAEAAAIDPRHYDALSRQPRGCNAFRLRPRA